MRVVRVSVYGGLGIAAGALTLTAVGCGASGASNVEIADAGFEGDATPPADSTLEARTSDAANAADGLSPVDTGAEAATSHDGGPRDAGASIDGASDAAPGCSISGRATAARSSGFSGGSSAYFSLFDSVPCAMAAECVPSCVGAGGTTGSCALGEQCVTDFRSDGGFGCIECLPPTYWLDPSGALGQPGSGTTTTPANDVQAFDNGYNDSLLVTGFAITLPNGALVRGIQFDVDRSADDGNGADQSVRALRAGTAVGVDHAIDAPWPQSYTVATYGGPDDNWGVSWSASDVGAAHLRNFDYTAVFGR